MVGMCEINEKFPEVDMVGIAADKKKKDVERFLEKGACHRHELVQLLCAGRPSCSLVASPVCDCCHCMGYR